MPEASLTAHDKIEAAGGNGSLLARFESGHIDTWPGEDGKDTRPRKRARNTTERRPSMAAKKARYRIAQLNLGRIGDEETREIGRARIDWLAEDRPRPTTREVPLALNWIRAGQ